MSGFIKDYYDDPLKAISDAKVEFGPTPARLNFDGRVFLQGPPVTDEDAQMFIEGRFGDEMRAHLSRITNININLWNVAGADVGLELDSGNKNNLRFILHDIYVKLKSKFPHGGEVPIKKVYQIFIKALQTTFIEMSMDLYAELGGAAVEEFNEMEGERRREYRQMGEFFKAEGARQGIHPDEVTRALKGRFVFFSQFFNQGFSEVSEDSENNFLSNMKKIGEMADWSAPTPYFAKLLGLKINYENLRAIGEGSEGKVSTIPAPLGSKTKFKSNASTTSRTTATSPTNQCFAVSSGRTNLSTTADITVAIPKKTDIILRGNEAGGFGRDPHICYICGQPFRYLNPSDLNHQALVPNASDPSSPLITKFGITGNIEDNRKYYPKVPKVGGGGNNTHMNGGAMFETTNVPGLYTQKIDCEHILPVISACAIYALSKKIENDNILNSTELKFLVDQYQWAHGPCNQTAKESKILVKINKDMEWIPDVQTICEMVHKVKTEKGARLEVLKSDDPVRPTMTSSWDQIDEFWKDQSVEEKTTILRIVKILQNLCDQLNMIDQQLFSGDVDGEAGDTHKGLKRAICEIYGRLNVLAHLRGDIIRMVGGFEYNGRFISNVVPNDITEEKLESIRAELERLNNYGKERGVEAGKGGSSTTPSPDNIYSNGQMDDVVGLFSVLKALDDVSKGNLNIPEHLTTLIMDAADEFIDAFDVDSYLQTRDDGSNPLAVKTTEKEERETAEEEMETEKEEETEKEGREGGKEEEEERAATELSNTSKSNYDALGNMVNFKVDSAAVAAAAAAAGGSTSPSQKVDKNTIRSGYTNRNKTKKNKTKKNKKKKNKTKKNKKKKNKTKKNKSDKYSKTKKKRKLKSQTRISKN